MKKTTRYITLLTLITLNITTLAPVAEVFANEAQAVQTLAETTKEYTAEAGKTIRLNSYHEETPNASLVHGKKYRISFAGTGQLEMYHDNSFETYDVARVVDGKINGSIDSIVRTIAEGDYYHLVAASDKSITVKITAFLNADKTQLNNLITKAKTLKENDYTAETWSKLTSALNNAKTVVANVDASQTVVDNAFNALNTAIKGLIKETSDVDKTALDAKIKVADKLVKADYTSETWSKFEASLKHAKQINNAIDAITQNDIDQALQKLTDGINQLVKINDGNGGDNGGGTIVDKVDFDNLEQAINNSESWLAYNITNSLKQSADNINKLVNDAQALIKNKDAKQDEVDKLTKKINEEVEKHRELALSQRVGNVANINKLHESALVLYDDSNSTLYFMSEPSWSDGYKNTVKLDPIKITKNQKTFEVWNRVYNLNWSNEKVKVEHNRTTIYSEIDADLSGYFTNYYAYRTTYNAKTHLHSVSKDRTIDYNYIDLKDVPKDNIKPAGEAGKNDNNEILKFNFTNLSFDFSLEYRSAFYPGALVGFKLPQAFKDTKIFADEVGKTHYIAQVDTNTYFSQDAIVVMYYRINADNTLDIWHDYYGFPTGKGSNIFKASFNAETTAPKSIIDRKVNKDKVIPTVEKKVEPKKVVKQSVPKMGNALLGGASITLLSAISAIGALAVEYKRKKQ